MILETRTHSVDARDGRPAPRQRLRYVIARPDTTPSADEAEAWQTCEAPIRGKNDVRVESLTRRCDERVGKPYGTTPGSHIGGEHGDVLVERHDDEAEVVDRLPHLLLHAASTGRDEGLREHGRRYPHIVVRVMSQRGDRSCVICIGRLERGDHDAGIEDD